MAGTKEKGPTLEDTAMDYIREQGIVRARELDMIGVPTVILKRLEDKGLLENPARGIYVIDGMLDDALANYAIEAVSMPETAVICLRTASYLHNMTTRNPDEFDIAMPPGSWRKTSATGLPVKTVRWADIGEDGSVTGDDTQYPATCHMELLGRKFRVTTKARTIVDLFRYRGARGENTNRFALEALSNATQNGDVTVAEIEIHARRLGVQGMMDPYLSGLSASYGVS